MKALRVPSRVRPAAATLALTAFMAASAFAAEPIAVTVDQARVLEMPAGAVTLIIGNPLVADVTILKHSNAMVITGKGFGDTNFVALDKAGKPIAESQIVVRSNPGVILVQRGLKRHSYSCVPQCQPSVQLGDEKEFFGDAGSQIQLRNQMSGPGGAK